MNFPLILYDIKALFSMHIIAKIFTVFLLLLNYNSNMILFILHYNRTNIIIISAVKQSYTGLFS